MIDGLDGPVDRYAFGVDGLQAVGVAIEMARVHLQPAAGDPPLMTWLGGDDLGLPRLLPVGATRQGDA